MFNNRKLVIATKHEKEIVIVPLLEKELGVQSGVNETRMYKATILSKQNPLS
jgi:hypothetical protein